MPDEKSLSEALELSRRNPGDSGVAATSGAPLMVATSFTLQRPVEFVLREIANSTDQQLQLQSIRLLI
ncbi:MAG: hypothetical protein ACLP9L_04175 [Thermoguttaceae bacterium]